ncbi:hypothetical protein SOVF_178770, partial [Spinacia oleracea]
SSGGLFLGWKKKSQFTIAFSCLNFIVVDVNDEINGKWSLILAYGDPYHENREKVWQQLSPWTTNSSNEPVLLVGDFNQVDSQTDKQGGNKSKIRGINKFTEWREQHKLYILEFSGPRFTWTNGRRGKNRIMERLDKAYANQEWMSKFPQAQLINGTIATSDHAPIILMTSKEKKQVKRGYKVEAWSLEYDQCLQTAKSNWDREVRGSPMYRCARKIQYCREGMKKWSLEKRKDWSGKWDCFERDMVEAQLLLENSGNDEKFEEVKSRLEEYAGNMAKYWKQQAKIKWNCAGDACSRYFFNFVKGRKARNKIEGLKDEDDNWIVNEKEISKLINDHFRDIYQ